MVNDIETCVRKLAMRKERLMHLEQLVAPTRIIDREKNLVRQAEIGIQLYLQKMELVCYQIKLDDLKEHKDATECPACKYMYEMPDGRKLTEEELLSEDRKCTLPTAGLRNPLHCRDFVDYGIVNREESRKIAYAHMQLVNGIISQTRQTISGLEAELQGLSKDLKAL